MKVISFNIRCANDPNGHSIEERAPRLGATIAEYAPDIIGFQEYRPRWEPYWSAVINGDYEEMNVDRGDGEGLVLLWRKERFEALDKDFFWFADDPHEPSTDWDEKYHKPRICAYAVLRDRKTGTVFTYMNTHYGFGDDCQVKSSQLLYEKCRELGNELTIITGDFNMKPDSLGYKAMTGYFADVNAATDRLATTTFHKYGCTTGAIIDYCFISDRVVPVSYEVITKTFDGKYPSDHYGICVTLDI